MNSPSSVLEGAVLDAGLVGASDLRRPQLQWTVGSRGWRRQLMMEGLVEA